MAFRDATSTANIRKASPENRGTANLWLAVHDDVDGGSAGQLAHPHRLEALGTRVAGLRVGALASMRAF
jgi:hypothetical protein